jgi:hypothetical protein
VNERHRQHAAIEWLRHPYFTNRPKSLDMKVKLPSAVFVVFVATLIVGCGPGGPAVHYVEGTVTFDGKPLDKAKVFFYPQAEDGGLPATGTSDVAGNYKLTSMQGGGIDKGATAGDYSVAVVRQQDTPSRTEKIPAVTPGAADEVMTFYDSLIPEKYTTKQTTPLKFTVVKGKNRFDINLDKE